MATTHSNDFEVEMNSLLEHAGTAIMAAECRCIYKVPPGIRRLNEDSFTPTVISIGPIHYGHPTLQNMEEYKLVYLKQFRERISSSVSFARLISFVEEIEPRVRLHYSEAIELSSKELVKVILLDSCFFFELFLRSYFCEWVGVPRLQPWQDAAIRLDLLLLENQLPFPELKRLYNRIFPPSMTDGHMYPPSKRRYNPIFPPSMTDSHIYPPSFLHLTFDFFDCHNNSNFDPQGVVSITHFTDLIRTFHLPPRNCQLRRHSKLSAHRRSAAELGDRGMKFRKSESPCLLDFKISGRILEIPQLKLDIGTETLLRNLVVLEQCHYSSHPYISDYIAIMDFLINTSNDVDLLVQEGIILNGLGESNSVANLFNSLGNNVTNIKDFNCHYLKICEGLNSFCRSPWNRVWLELTSLRHDYCNTTWQAVASIAGMLLLLLTLIQAVCSVLQVVPLYKQSP